MTYHDFFEAVGIIVCAVLGVIYTIVAPMFAYIWWGLKKDPPHCAPREDDI